MRQMSLQLLLALILLLCIGSPAFALIAGFNADIHMDIDGVIADDFHIEGRIKSGPWMGGWSQPPVLVLHIDGMFPNFTRSIVPDNTVPGENTYKFTADWSGHPYQYCEILHLGLFFDVECHNLVIDLVGWWTAGGRRIIDGKNGGAVLIPGFDVQDQQQPQLLQIRNDSAQIVDDGGILPGIHGQIVQMDVSVLSREELLGRFGTVEELARGLRLGGVEGQLEWMPVRSGDDFPAESFFDVTFGVDTNLPTIPPQGFLVTRVLTAFTNNNGDPEPDFRWTWHLHESHEVQENMDWGDAPEDMSGVIGKYPTLLVSNGARHFIRGPWIGDASDSPDPEGNGQPEVNAMGDDIFDGNDDEDGVQIPILIQGVGDTIMVEVNGGGGVVDAWIDWDGSRTWEAAEQIHNLFLPDGIHPIPVMPPVNTVPGQTFARFRISRQGGLSPLGIAQDGEVEDHEVFIEVIEEQLDWGDAPESTIGLPGLYQTTFNFNGARHPLGQMWLGDKTDNTDPDRDGQPDPQAIGDDTYDGNDDEDGVQIPDLVQGVANTIIVEVNGIGGVLDAWIDYNGDRVWQDPGERIAGGVFLAPGLHPIPVTAPVGSVVGQTFARFRISHNGGLPPVGLGPAGEVEDHEVIIEERPPTGTIHGRKFEDLNANGIHDPGEPYLNGWKIELYDAAGNLIATTVTADMDLNNDGTIDPSSESGLYWFTNLPLGDYTVQEVLQPEWTPSTPPSVSVTVTNLGVVVVDFGNFVTGSIHGFKFEDVDRDGNYDSSVDVPMGGVEFTLDGTDGQGNAVSMTTTTNANGEFAFVNLVPGIYTVKEIVPAGWIATTPISFTLTIHSREEYVALPGQANLSAGDPRIEIVYGVELMFGNATEINLDFGDAPQNAGAPGYPTLLPNGARHKIDPDIYLGNDIDPEWNGQPTNGADGDDVLDGNDDEDGIKFLTNPLRPGRWAKVEVTASIDGLLSAWVDFDKDGTWMPAGDRIFNSIPVMAGTHNYSFWVPATAKPNVKTYSRWRFSTDPVPSPAGPAKNGEVEDHIVKIRSNPNVKWIQRPDETPMGIDIRVDSSDGVERVLADDWQCTEYGPITDVHLWVSWLQDIKGEIESIHLSVHTDIPADPDEPLSYSRPGDLKWAADFGPDSFKEKIYRKLEEGEYWWDPYEGTLIPAGDHQIWQIDIDIPASDAFQQEGTPDDPVVYWLDVSIKLKEDMNAAIGWKTRRYPKQFNDDAVMGATDLGVVYWNDLHYPYDHPYYLEDPDNPPSLDMAFMLTSDDCDICLGSADLNGDGDVDLADAAILADQYLTDGRCDF